MTGWTSPSHLLVLLLIALIFFGGKRLPEIGRSLGLGMREFKESVTGGPTSAGPRELPDEARPVAAEDELHEVR